MRIVQQEFEHPRQVTRARLNLYRYVPPEHERVAGMLPAGEGYHVTEDRVGTTTVVASLGFFAGEAEARERLQRRAEELLRQGYRAATSPARQESIPAGALGASEPDGARAALASRTEPERVVLPGDPTPRPVKPA